MSTQTTSETRASAKALGARLRGFRRRRGLAGTTFAEGCGIQPEALAAYECGRVRIPWHAARGAWRFALLSPVWLATGEGPELLPFEPFRATLPRFDSSARFEEVFPQLAPIFAAAAEALRPLHVASVEQFLDDARAGGADALLALVADTIARHQATRPNVIAPESSGFTRP